MDRFSWYTIPKKGSLTMDSCIYCGGPAGIDVVERPEGPEHYSKVECAKNLKNSLGIAVRWLRRLEKEYPGCLNEGAIDRHISSESK